MSNSNLPGHIGGPAITGPTRETQRPSPGTRPPTQTQTPKNAAAGPTLRDGRGNDGLGSGATVKPGRG